MIFAITSKNIEDVCTPLAWEGEQPVAISGHSCAYATESIIPRYQAYLATAQDFQISKRKGAKGAKVIEAAPVDLARVGIPAPSIATQRKVVDILDRFDTLTASLTDGLPAEMRLLTGKTVRIPPQLMGGVELRALIVGHALNSTPPHLQRAVQHKVHLEHVDRGLAEDAQESALGALGDDLAHLAFALARGLRQARYLVLGGIGGDLGVEP